VNVQPKALLLLASVRAALLNGCRHYDKRGRFLRTELQILSALMADGKITVDESMRVDRTTVDEQMKNHPRF
jgi:hypothetical protein